MTTTESKPETMEDILYHLTVLHERWAAEKHDFTKQVIKIDQLIKEFTVRINELDKRQSSTAREVISTVQSEAREVYSDIDKGIGRAIDKEVKKTLDRFKVAVEESYSYQLQSWRQESRRITLGGIVVAISGTLISSLIVSSIIVKSFLPMPAFPLSDRQMNEVKGGEIMALMWPKLSKQDQIMLLKVKDKVFEEHADGNTETNKFPEKINWWETKAN